mgnify:CR=1 FL=1
MTGNYNRSRAVLRVESLYRIFFKGFICDKSRCIDLNEFPKSGGSWLGEMLADAAEIDFPRNRFPDSRAMLFHGHSLRNNDIIRKVVLWRDPRDVMISWYHHCVIGNSHVNPRVVSQVRAQLKFADPLNVAENLSAFIEWSFLSPMSPRFSWSRFFDVWFSRADVVNVRYEDFRLNPIESLSFLLDKLSIDCDIGQIERIVDAHSFERVSGRSPGVEDKASFVRKGAIGDWMNYFDDESMEVLRNLVGGRAELLGYDLSK